ncbi:MAG TPA: DinB family protein [Anaerolineae bacterium]
MMEIMNRDGLLILCDYDIYANNLVLETCAKLTEDEFTRESSPSHHSVRRLILHALETEQAFLSLCQERPPQGLPALASVSDIRDHWANVTREIRNSIASSNDDDLRREIPFPFRIKGQSRAFSRWQMFLQAFMHAAQHRSELAIILAELGHPLPNLDIILSWIGQNR